MLDTLDGPFNTSCHDAPIIFNAHDPSNAFSTCLWGYDASVDELILRGAASSAPRLSPPTSHFVFLGRGDKGDKGDKVELNPYAGGDVSLPQPGCRADPLCPTGPSPAASTTPPMAPSPSPVDVSGGTFSVSGASPVFHSCTFDRFTAEITVQHHHRR